MTPQNRHNARQCRGKRARGNVPDRVGGRGEQGKGEGGHANAQSKLTTTLSHWIVRYLPSTPLPSRFSPLQQPVLYFGSQRITTPPPSQQPAQQQPQNQGETSTEPQRPRRVPGACQGQTRIPSAAQRGSCPNGMGGTASVLPDSQRIALRLSRRNRPTFSVVPRWRLF